LIDTLNVEARGKTYTIKRWSLDESILVDDFVEAHKNKFKEQQAFIVFTGVVTPKFESIEAVRQEDFETVAKLWYEIQNFNRYDTNFLSLLRKSSQQVVPPDVTRTP